MDFPASLFTGIIVLSCGAAAGNILSFLLCRSHPGGRLTGFFLLVSLAAGSFTLCVILSPFNIKECFSPAAAVWAVSLFAGGMVCAVFYRTVLPAAVLLYAAVSVYSYNVLREKYPYPAEINAVSIDAASAQIYGTEYALHKSEDGSSCIAFEVCRINPLLLLPVKRFWYKPAAGSDLQEELPEAWKRNIFSVYKKVLFAFRSVHLVPVPESNMNASVYALKFSRRKNTPEFIFTRVI